MTTWGDLEVGSKVVYEGADHVVLVLKRGGISIRTVLQPMAAGSVAKVAVRARLSDKVELVAGTEAPDRAGSAITQVLMGEQVAEIKRGDDLFTCPPIDFTTIRSHLRILHGVELQGLPENSDEDLMRVHRELHAAPFHEPPFPHRHEESAA